MVIADTGFWVALAYPKDAHHALAKQRLAELAAQDERSISAIFVPTVGKIISRLRICCWRQAKEHKTAPSECPC